LASADDETDLEGVVEPDLRQFGRRGADQVEVAGFERAAKSGRRESRPKSWEHTFA